MHLIFYEATQIIRNCKWVVVSVLYHYTHFYKINQTNQLPVIYDISECFLQNGFDENLIMIFLFSESASGWQTIYLKLNVRELFNLLERH